MLPLDGTRILTLAINLPGPLAVARLREMGATVVKVEPPDGDPLNMAMPEWYRELHEGVEILPLNLKIPIDRERLNERLGRADLLITATRPAALARLGLAWSELQSRYPRLSQVAIVGYPAPREEMPGHDLTYQAQCGLIVTPALPRACIADWAGSQEVVIAALGLLLGRQRGRPSQFVQVSLAAAAERFAEPFHRGLTRNNGVLGGGFPGYDLYETRKGWVAIAALEPHFRIKLVDELGIGTLSRERLEQAFRERSADEWQAWAEERDLPLVAVANEATGKPR